jgi:hypothetical protein
MIQMEADKAAQKSVRKHAEHPAFADAFAARGAALFIIAANA